MTNALFYFCISDNNIYYIGKKSNFLNIMTIVICLKIFVTFVSHNLETK